MKKFKTAAVFPLLIITMIMSVACASDSAEETVATTAQVEENVEQKQQEVITETTQRNYKTWLYIRNTTETY